VLIEESVLLLGLQECVDKPKIKLLTFFLSFVQEWRRTVFDVCLVLRFVVVGYEIRKSMKGIRPLH